MHLQHYVLFNFITRTSLIANPLDSLAKKDKTTLVNDKKETEKTKRHKKFFFDLFESKWLYEYKKKMK
jgi:hypothetical protein